MELRPIRHGIAGQLRNGSLGQHFHQSLLRFHPDGMSPAPLFSVAVWPLRNAQVDLRRTLDGLHHFEQRNILCAPSQLKSTSHSALRGDQSRLHQLLQDLGHKTFWRINGACQSRPMNPFRNGGRGQMNRYSDCVVGGSGDLHTSNRGLIGPFSSDLQRISKRFSLVACQ
jgi:hypothetical protein